MSARAGIKYLPVGIDPPGFSWNLCGRCSSNLLDAAVLDDHSLIAKHTLLIHWNDIDMDKSSGFGKRKITSSHSSQRWNNQVFMVLKVDGFPPNLLARLHQTPIRTGDQIKSGSPKETAVPGLLNGPAIHATS